MNAQSLAADPSLRKEELSEARLRLRNHQLYGRVQTTANLRTFMEHHVVCVLDFMALLKSLQRDLTCIDVPWTPTDDPDSTRLIQSIALDEEADIREDGRVQSHFAWYVEAMEEIGADVQAVRTLVEDLNGSHSLSKSINSSNLPGPSQTFGQSTAAFLTRPVHVRAAVFFHGREEIIPEMFLPIVEGLGREGLECSAFRSYLLRHIEIDSEDHGPLAEKMLDRMYRGDAALQSEAEIAALEALAARRQLWDAISQACS